MNGPRTVVLTLITAFTLFQAGCSNLVKKGDKLYEQGLFVEAEEFYARALRRDPDDVEALAGLKRARVKIIDRGLIDVRMLRLNRDLKAAAAKLEDLLLSQKTWDLVPVGAVALTQQEEVGESRNWLLNKASELSSSPFPDQFRWLVYSHETLIATAGLEPALADNFKTAARQARKNCLSASRQAIGQQFFLGDFAKRYCTYWKVEAPLSLDKYDSSRFRSLDTRRAEIRLAPEHFDHQLGRVKAELSDLKKQFQYSIWYSPLARKSLELETSFYTDYSYLVRSSKRNKSYHVRESYISTDDAGKEVKKSKKVKQSHRYRVQTHTEDYALDLLLKSTIAGRTVSANVNRKEQHRSESHDEDFPDANLRPQPVELFDVDAFLFSNISSVKNRYLQALNEHWAETYCGQLEAGIAEEALFRCAAVSPQDPRVNNWLLERYGVDYRQIKTLYP